jgi:tetratricopeptide (TPR) repeat protein
MTGTIVIIALVLFVAFTFMHGQSSSGSGSSSGSRRNQERADALIGQAESHIMLGKLAEAEANYSQATVLAAGDPLLLSEAHYGLCRVCEKRKDWAGALRQIDASLSYAPEWRDWKPNFESLLKREKERLLEESSKQQ